MEYNSPQGPPRMPAPMAGVAFLAGIGAGAVVALLLAPRRGVELRGQLMRKMAEVQQHMNAKKGKFDMQMDNASESVEEALSRVQQALKRERLNSIKEEQEKP